MTDKTELVEVEQVDRDAAAPWVIVSANDRKIRAGEMDWNPLVQAFAKLRLQALLAPGLALEAARFELAEQASGNGSCDTAAAALHQVEGAIAALSRTLTPCVGEAKVRAALARIVGNSRPLPNARAEAVLLISCTVADLQDALALIEEPTAEDGEEG